MNLGPLTMVWKPKREIVQPSLETLTAFVVPKKIFQDDTYKDEQGIVKDSYGTYFDSCAADLCRIFMNTYSPTFEFEKSAGEGQVRYQIKSPETLVLYTLRGIDRFSGSTESWSNDVSGIVSVQQPKIDLQRAATFIQTALQYNMLDYRNQTFGIFLDAAGEKTISEGIPLLQTLGIRPAEAAEYISIMMYGRYTHKQFTQAELESLFPEPKT